jgi:hypothetical protein
MIKEYVIKKRMFLFDESDIEKEKIHNEIEDKLNEKGIVYDRIEVRSVLDPLNCECTFYVTVK